MNKPSLSTEAAKTRAIGSPFAAIRSLLTLLTPRERRRSVALLLVAVAMALVETLGVTSVMPFLAVLGNPDVIHTNRILNWLYTYLGYSSVNDFLFALGIAALVVVLLAAVFRAAAQYAVFRFTNMRRYSISMRLFDGYLTQPYAFFLNRNSADLTKRALSDVDMIVDHCLMPGVQLVAYAMVVMTLVALLIIVDPLVAASVLTVLCGFYAGIYLLSRNLLLRIGRDRNLANRQRFMEASEAFGGIKEIKLLGCEGNLTERFKHPALRFAKHRATNDTIALVPRYLIEAIAFGGALAMTLVLMRTRDDLGGILPILGLYAFAGYRLLPAVQQIYHGLTRIRFGLPMVTSVEEDLNTHAIATEHSREAALLPFRRSICFESVTFRYPGSTRSAIDSLELEILANTTVGFIGTTGAGKTTVADLLLGLLEPTKGRILIDGEPLTESNRRAWQRNIGYVPQMIFLADATVAENIAFGIPRDAIDQAAVERSARLANIHEFVISELASGYKTLIGERGVRLSGGQRQRIGIARALYRNPSLLVFDEATSALDNATEAAVIEAIGKLQHEKTIITIAHRLTTVQGHDQIWRFEAGRAFLK